MEYDANTEYLGHHPDAVRFDGIGARVCGSAECRDTPTWRVKPWATWHGKPYCAVHARRILEAASFIKSGAKTYEQQT